MCPSGARCLPADCCVRELALSFFLCDFLVQNVMKWSLTHVEIYNHGLEYFILVITVSDCCLMPIQQFSSYIMARTSFVGSESY
jgi:hypothetical protein